MCKAVLRTIACLALALTGCAGPGEFSQGRVIADYELSGYLKRDFGIAGLNQLIADDSYQLVSERWFFTDFAALLRADLSRNGLSQYVPRSNDCDDFTRNGASLAQRLNARRFSQSALAVGEFWYQQRDGNFHVILIAAVDRGGKLAPVFMEPQTQRQVFLTEAEILSCQGLRF